MAAKFKCPKCDNLILAPTRWPSVNIACSNCREHVPIPTVLQPSEKVKSDRTTASVASPPNRAEPEANDESTKFECPKCQKLIVIPSDHTRINIACGICYQWVDIPSELRTSEDISTDRTTDSETKAERAAAKKRWRYYIFWGVFWAVGLILAFVYGTLSGPTELEALQEMAKQGDAVAQFGLGCMYDTGKGVPEDDVEAAKWYRMAAEQGSSNAQYVLGQMYDNGKGVPEDDVEAAKWYRKAAELGNASAQYRLGFMYAEGTGVPEDDVEALMWFRKAAEQGQTMAQVNLGLMYRTADGVPKDDVEAVKWFRKAAEQGDALAQVNLGFMYANGKGVPKDDVEAYAWFSVAVAKGQAESVEFRDKAKATLTSDQLARAQQRAAKLFEHCRKP